MNKISPPEVTVSNILDILRTLSEDIKRQEENCWSRLRNSLSGNIVFSPAYVVNL